ncbi:hypothetical protein THF5H11_30204 [Vibrio jasicida]|nr:hypothetical protein THF5H11_30204 [Vibrio jasicida]
MYFYITYVRSFRAQLFEWQDKKSNSYPGWNINYVGYRST